MSLVYKWGWEYCNNPDKFTSYDWNKVKKAIKAAKCDDKHADAFLVKLVKSGSLIKGTMNDIGQVIRKKLITPDAVMNKMAELEKKIKLIDAVEKKRPLRDAEKSERTKLQVARKALGVPIKVIAGPQLLKAYSSFDCSVHLKGADLVFQMSHLGKSVKFNVTKPK